MKKNRIRLTESQLRNIIKESVKKYIREWNEFDDNDDSLTREMSLRDMPNILNTICRVLKNNPEKCQFNIGEGDIEDSMDVNIVVGIERSKYELDCSGYGNPEDGNFNMVSGTLFVSSPTGNDELYIDGQSAKILSSAINGSRKGHRMAKYPRNLYFVIVSDNKKYVDDYDGLFDRTVKHGSVFYGEYTSENKYVDSDNQTHYFANYRLYDRKNEVVGPYELMVEPGDIDSGEPVCSHESFNYYVYSSQVKARADFKTFSTN